MKNLILIIALPLVFTNCKKKLSNPKEDIYCCFIENNGNRSFYKCASTKEEMISVSVEIRNNNLGSIYTTRKSECSECQ